MLSTDCNKVGDHCKMDVMSCPVYTEKASGHKDLCWKDCQGSRRIDQESRCIDQESVTDPLEISQALIAVV